MNYNYTISVVNHPLYPVIVLKGKCFSNVLDESISIFQTRFPEWGYAAIVRTINCEPIPLPDKIELAWLSILEKKAYCLDYSLNIKEAESLWDKYERNLYTDFKQILLGIAPYGKIAIWFCGFKNSVLFTWVNAMEMELDTSKNDTPWSGLSIENSYNECLSQNEEIKTNFLSQGNPPLSYFDRMMQQFTYRFLPVLKKWDEDNEAWTEYDEDEIQPELDFVEVKCHDSTFDRLRDGSLLNYHEAGKPSRVCVGWHVSKREYSAYFFFSHDELAQVFRTCYGAHPDTKVDFLLMIDPESDKYEPALFRYGMNEPLPIGPDACQVLAFRNKFECYRSPNYTQPKGAWR